MPIFPIGFSIHSSKVTRTIPEKKRLLSPIIPGGVSNYLYNNETDYYNDYKQSYFALTFKKAGWDCMRHYEILACGCIPLFIDLDKCPKNTMTFFPKSIIEKTNKLYESLTKYNSVEQISEEEKNICNNYINILLEYTRDHLTNDKIAQYILNKVNINAKRVLFLSGDLAPDYLRCMTLVGFKQILATECHDYPKIPHIYTDYDEQDAKKCYGKGISYTRNIDVSTRKGEYDLTVKDDIIKHRYDLVIYGSYHRGMPFWDEVNASYKPSEIVLVCGEDIDFHSCDYNTYLPKGYNLFVREITDDSV